MDYGFDRGKVREVMGKVEADYEPLAGVIAEIVGPFCRDLDKYVDFIRGCLKDGDNPPTDAELEDWTMNLSTYIYFAGGMCEQLGIKDDISKAIWREIYNTARQDGAKGTVQDKNALAELASQQEFLTNVCYSRAYKILKGKVEAAQEILQSAKKCLSHRMVDMELTRIGGRYNGQD